MKRSVLIILMLFAIVSCTGRHEEKIDIGQLITLPDNYYGYRNGSVFVHDVGAKKFQMWYSLDEDGNLDRLFRIDNFVNKADSLSALKEFGIDTVKQRADMLNFIRLSRKFRFGHISMEKKVKCYLSRIEDMNEQYVYAFTDSVKAVYLKDKDYECKDGWFVFKE